MTDERRKKKLAWPDTSLFVCVQPSSFVRNCRGSSNILLGLLPKILILDRALEPLCNPLRMHIGSYKLPHSQSSKQGACCYCPGICLQVVAQSVRIRQRRLPQRETFPKPAVRDCYKEYFTISDPQRQQDKCDVFFFTAPRPGLHARDLKTDHRTKSTNSTIEHSTMYSKPTYIFSRTTEIY